MIDLHTHILPGVDDGAQDMEEALEMAYLAVQSGVHTLTATPHSNQRGYFENWNSSKLQKVYESFCLAVRKEKIPLEVLPGMEIYSSDDLQELIRDRQIIGMNHSAYYLLEFPFDSDADIISHRLTQVLDMGKFPLIAHPERYFCVWDMPELVYRWIQMGCVTQINKGSIFGKFGRHAKKAAEILFRYHLVTCVASDAHSPYMRTTYMKDIYKELVHRFGVREADLLTEENPARILQNRKIKAHGELPARRRYFFR